MDSDDAGTDFIARKIFEEEIHRVERPEDTNLAKNIKCRNYHKIEHIKADCYSKGEKE